MDVLMTLDRVLEDPPKVHAWEPGTLTSSGLPRECFEYISSHIDATSHTLETGAGISTVVFALRQTQHICVAPDRAEVDRLKAYCDAAGIPTSSIEFHLVRSDQFFQRWQPQPLDLVLIDGCHGFPAPFIDWFYTAASIRLGGMLVIDDTHLWTGAVLKEFLAAEPEWQLDGPRSPKTAVFRKVADYVPWKEWTRQPYVSDRSRLPRPLWSRARRVLSLARAGQYGVLVKKAIRHLRG